MRGAAIAFGLVVVVGLIAALFYMRTALDIFIFRKAMERLHERGPVQWRDARTWESSKRLSAKWVAASGLYLGGAAALSLLVTEAHPAWAALYAVIPLVVIAWLALMRKK